MAQLKIKEALAYAVAMGKNIDKVELAAKIFPEATKENQYMKMANLIAGRVKRVKPETVVIICQECGVSADFLFGLKQLNNE